MASTVTRPRLFLLLALCLAGFLIRPEVPVLAPQAYAQEDEEKPKAEAAKASTGSSHSFLDIFKHVIKSVGLVFGVVLGAISIALLTLIVLLFMELRMTAAISPGFVEEFTETVNKRRFKEAYEMAKEDQSYLGRVLTTGMGRLQYGIDDAREASFNMVDSLKASKEMLINYLGTIGTLGPLLGLVGTVWGMILAFMELASATSGVNAQRLADAISHALVVTMLGIGMSVPAIFFHTFFRNRLVGLSHDIGTVSDDLLTQMYHNSKKAGVPAPSAASEPAAEGARPAPPPAPAAVKQK